MVACDSTDDDEYVVLRPCFVAEFPTPFTDDVIYGEKLDVYRRMPSLQSILIGHQTRPRIELHTRDETGVWTEQVIEGGGEVVLPALKLRIPLAVIYDDVEFDVDTNATHQPAQ
jgi:Uma2 family endonuclease